MMNNSTNVINYWKVVSKLQREAFRNYQLIPLSFIIVIGFVCNILVIYTATRRRTWKKYAISPFILSLALADLGVIIYFIPIHFVEYTIGLNVSDWTCKYIIPIRETFVAVSLFTVATLSMVRFWYIRFSREFSKRFIYTVIIFTWVFAYLVISMPISFVIRQTPGMTCDHVWENETHRTVHIVMLNIMQLLPLLITTICYINIITKMRKAKAQRRNTVTNGSQRNGNELGILMLIMAAWWSFAPFLVYSFLSILHIEIAFPLKAWSAISVFLTSSSAINPVLVLLLYKSYRDEISNLFFKKDPTISMPTTGVTSAKTDTNMQELEEEQL